MALYLSTISFLMILMLYLYTSHTGEVFFNLTDDCECYIVSFFDLSHNCVDAI